MKNVSLAFLLLAACNEPVGAVIEEAPPTATAADLEEARITRAMPWMIVADVWLEDAGGDYVWEPGENAILHATLVNTRSRDFMWYPGITAAADDPRVTVVGQGWLYGISGRTTTPISMEVSADGLSSGDVVTFTVKTDSLGCTGSGPCPAADTMTFTAEVQ